MACVRPLGQEFSTSNPLAIDLYDGMKWILAFIFALAMSAAADAQTTGRSHAYSGLGNLASSGLGARTDKALPLLEPQRRRPAQTSFDWDDYYRRQFGRRGS